MPPSNVDIVRSEFAAFNRGDIDELSSRWHPDGEFIPILARLEGRVYRGPEGVRQWAEDIAHDWEVFEPCPQEYHDLGDRVLVLGSWRARARTSGVEMDSAPATWIIEFRDGQVWRWETFTDRDEAFRVAGFQPS